MEGKEECLKYDSRAVNNAIERDVERLQLALPFPEEKTIDMPRCCGILHVSPQVVRRLLVTPLPGTDRTCLVGYNTMAHSPLRIDYSSVAGYLDHLRKEFAIRDRRPAPAFGRYRDDDLLPFPWSDTITVEEAADALGIHPSKVLLRIEAGQFEAYQLVKRSPWRVSRSSLAQLIASFGTRSKGDRPYSGVACAASR